MLIAPAIALIVEAYEAVTEILPRLGLRWEKPRGKEFDAADQTGWIA